MNKKVILWISIILNIILGIVFLVNLPGAVEELKFEYVEQETIRPDSLRMYLERENYGTAAALSRIVRAGAQVSETDLDYFKLGEYAELLFLKPVMERAGNADTVAAFEAQMAEIRSAMPAYSALFDKIDLSTAGAVKE